MRTISIQRHWTIRSSQQGQSRRSKPRRIELAVKSIPVSLAYAIWSGLGIELIPIVGYVVFRQPPDLAAPIGLGGIIVGVIVNVFSKSIVH